MELKGFSDRIRSGKCQIGTLVTLDCPELVEILCAAEFDWLFFDAEHSPLNPRAIQRLLMCMKRECASIVRVPENSAVCIKQFIDLGVDGIIIPQVRTPQEAVYAVAAAKYPPLGERSVGIARAHKYGADFANYVARANSITSLIVQIEHIDALPRLKDILGVPGIDGVLIGPYDLSGSMGLLGQVAHEKVQEAIHQIKTACVSMAIPYGIFVAYPDAAPSEINKGCKFIAIGIDAMLFGNVAASIMKTANQAL
jgi:2-keto-3-deoxy-L-rhamnonate aldolase RhmA